MDAGVQGFFAPSAGGARRAAGPKRRAKSVRRANHATVWAMRQCGTRSYRTRAGRTRAGGHSARRLESGMIDSALDARLPRAHVASAAASLGDCAGRDFTDLVKTFSQFGQPSAELWQGPVRYLINEFWTSTQRQAHSIHEVSYRACFKPQLPEFFIERLTRTGDAVYDPFMGRGTTPLQAALMGRRPVGNDVNPLSVLLTRPRLNAPTANALVRRLDEIAWDAGKVEDAELLGFYSPRTLRHLP